MAMFRKETTVFSIRKAVGSIDNAQFLRQSCTYWVEDVQIYQKQGLLRGQRSKITAFSIRWHGFFAKFIVVNSLSKTRLIEQSAQRVC